ncbi:hypothetical protein [Kingella potus]|uniref:hypothetical protein n=1 Tax=Kingella potus TaxID=265175 RepID=UPI0015589F5D|nr:hypothetical protein [Kingella potus]UOP01090.1 hypothetical protein LVJ84_01670 [Kingella potus]
MPPAVRSPPCGCAFPPLFIRIRDSHSNIRGRLKIRFQTASCGTIRLFPNNRKDSP